MNNHIEYYNLKKFINRKAIEIYIIVLGSLVLIYLLISLYFVNHFFLNTVINNVNVSLKSYQDGEELLKIYPTNYELLLIEREGTTEKLNGVDIKYKFNENNRLHIIHSAQQSFKWVFSLFKDRNYYVKDLYSFDRKILRDRIEYLRCLQGDKILPENVRFQYLEGSYQTIKEVKGNMINIDKFENT